mmetsp:Transcript_3530/g.6029  ORF Transcript_3530/g.6029 Transcript_3530/m.6029 type:complete len:94 (-) Transcript_3530:185-466(-)
MTAHPVVTSGNPQVAKNVLKPRENIYKENPFADLFNEGLEKGSKEPMVITERTIMEIGESFYEIPPKYQELGVIEELINDHELTQDFQKLSKE